MIYNTLIDVDSKYKEMHDSKEYKFFTFSRLEVPRRKALRNGLAILCNDTYLWVSSPDAILIHTLAGVFASKEAVKVAGLGFAVAGVASPGVYMPQEEETFRTLSPIVIRTAIETEDGVKRWDLSPADDEFVPRLLENLYRKYEMFSGHAPTGRIESIEVAHDKQQRIKILDTYHRAHLMSITLKGDPELIKFAYDCGLGEKNSMGFGMLQCVPN